MLLVSSMFPAFVFKVAAQNTSYLTDSTDDLYYYMSGSTASTWEAIDITSAEVSQVNRTHTRFKLRTATAIPLTNQWQSYFWLLETEIPAPSYWNPIDSNDLNVAFAVGVGWAANGPLIMYVHNLTAEGEDRYVHRSVDERNNPEKYFNGDTVSIIIRLAWIGNPTSIKWVANSGDGVGGETGRHDKAPNTGHGELNIPMASSILLPWEQWWFWAITTLGVTTCFFASTSLYYRKKALGTKKNRVTPIKPTLNEQKTCPSCGASLPADSRFCGKCGVLQE